MRWRTSVVLSDYTSFILKYVDVYYGIWYLRNNLVNNVKDSSVEKQTHDSHHTDDSSR